MASIKISELDKVVTLSPSDTLPITNEGDTKQVAISQLGDILATKEYVNKTVGELADMGFTPIIVNSLPTENIQTNTIYMILGDDGDGDNVYEEWMYINGAWEKVGSTGKVSLDDAKLAVNFVEISGGRWVTKSETGYDYDWHPIQSHNFTAFDNAIKNTKYNSTIFIKVLLSPIEVLFHSKLPLRTTWTSYTMQGIGHTSSGGIHHYAMTIYLSWDGETPTVTSISNLVDYNISGVSASVVLTKGNTTEFTPTGDYNPATKKYVDDSINSAISTALEADY